MDFTQLIYNLCMGFGNTLKLFALTLVFALPLGLLLSSLAMSKFKPISLFVKGFIWVIRGTPLMLQCILITYVLPLLGMTSKNLSIIFAIESKSVTFVYVTVAFIVNYACYFSVIYEGGFKNVSKGQHEAGQVLGMTKWQIFKNVTFMQVVRKITAPMSNEIITLVKDTSLAKGLGFTEVTVAAYDAMQLVQSVYPLICAGVFYLVFSVLLTMLFNFVEKKLSYYNV